MEAARARVWSTQGARAWPFVCRPAAGLSLAQTTRALSAPRTRLLAGAMSAPPSGVPYLGASISLISKSEIRYEGTLYSIDTKESNIALQNGARALAQGRQPTTRSAPR